MPLLPKLKDCHGRKNKKDARVSGTEWLDWKSVFQTQQGSFAHELTACIITVKVQNRYKSLHGMGGRGPTKSRPLLRSYWQLIASGKVSSLEGCGPWKVDHAPVVTQELLDCTNWTQRIIFFKKDTNLEAVDLGGVRESSWGEYSIIIIVLSLRWI